MTPETLPHPSPGRARRVVGQRKMGLASFRNWKPENGWKYDWDHGIAARSCRTTTEDQRHIVRNLLKAFVKTTAYAEDNYLMPESEVYTGPEQLRIPDIAYFSKEHDLAKQRGERLFPTFLIEIVSKTDTGLTYMKKLKEYFNAGAQVVWLIYPELSTIYIYHSMTEVKIVAEGGSCSAMPAVDFSIAVNDMLRL